LKLEEGPFVAYSGIVVGVGSRSTLLPPWELKEIPPSPREAPLDGEEVGVANVLLRGMLAVGVNEAGVLNVKGAVGVVLGDAGENPGVPGARVGKLVGLPPWHPETVMVTVETR
jgi:hypothetical protein